MPKSIPQNRILLFAQWTIINTRFLRILFQGIGFGLTFTFIFTLGSFICWIGLNGINFCDFTRIRGRLRSIIIGRIRFLLPRVRRRRLPRSLRHRTDDIVDKWHHHCFGSSGSRSIRKDIIQCAGLRVHKIKVLGMGNGLFLGYTCPHSYVFSDLIDK